VKLGLILLQDGAATEKDVKFVKINFISLNLTTLVVATPYFSSYKGFLFILK